MTIETTIGLIAIGVVVLGGLVWLYKEREKNDVINSLRPPIILPPPVVAKKAAKKAPAKKAVKKAVATKPAPVKKTPVAKYAAKKTSKK